LGGLISLGIGKALDLSGNQAGYVLKCCAQTFSRGQT